MNKQNNEQKIDLSGFYGTEAYHKLNLGNMRATDGFAYLCEKAKCHWLSDIISSVQNLDKIKEYKNFIVWRVIQSNNGKGCHVEAYFDCEEDGTYSVRTLIYSQKIGYTDFPFKELGTKFEFYQCGEIILLKSEY